jgi:arylsulfatase
VHGEHFGAYTLEHEMQYLTDGRSKYIWFPRTGRQQLFDLSSDPYELADLSEDPSSQAEVERWRSRLAEILEARDCGLARDGRLTPLTDSAPVKPPNSVYRVAGLD